MYDYSLFSKCDQGRRATPYNFDKGVVTFWEHKINLLLVIRVLRFGNYTMALVSLADVESEDFNRCFVSRGSIQIP